MQTNTCVYALSAALMAIGWGCGDDDDGSGTGGSGGRGGSGGTPTTSVGSGSSTGSGGGGAEACTVAARGIPVSAGRGSAPSIVWTGDKYAVAWLDLEGGSEGIRLTTITPEGAKTAEELIASGAQAANHPDLALRGNGLAVVWQEAAAQGSVIRGRLATREGAAQGAAFQIAQSPAAESWPVVAAQPSGFLVGWMETNQALAGFLDSSGALGETITIEQGKFPGVASDGGAPVLAWSTGAKLGIAQPAPGAPLAPAFHPGVSATITRVAPKKDDAFVVWEDMRAGEGAEQIYAIRAAQDGTFSTEAAVPGEPGSANYPAAAWTGTHLAVAYYQFRDGPPAVFLSRLTQDLSRVGEDVEVSGDMPARFPDIVWTGDELGIAYAENDGKVYLTRVHCP